MVQLDSPKVWRLWTPHDMSGNNPSAIGNELPPTPRESVVLILLFENEICFTATFVCIQLPHL